MKINIRHGYLHEDDMLALLQSLVAKVDEMSQELDTLVTEVEETKTVMGSAIVLLQGLKAALDAAGTDKVKLAELSASLDSKQQELAGAITTNTPSEP